MNHMFGVKKILYDVLGEVSLEKHLLCGVPIKCFSLSVGYCFELNILLQLFSEV
jgi:hypothetical protein